MCVSRRLLPIQSVHPNPPFPLPFALATLQKGAKVKDPGDGAWRTPSVLASIDSLLFQGLASVVFPSFTINRTVAVVGALLAQLPGGPSSRSGCSTSPPPSGSSSSL